MKPSEIVISNELVCHNEIVESLGAKAFGPGRFARTAFRVREGAPFENELSFVALIDNHVVGSVRITRVVIGARPGLLLGPLVVDVLYKNQGIGSLLMSACVNASRDMANELIILVGDEPYYQPFGFKKIPAGKITMPGPVDPARFLACELTKGSLEHFSGQVRAYSALNEIY
ncbi:MAG: N-acetyltransferase [Rhizobiaceae bacterium]|nr:N-acetyltransferase [Rhizobiaceae bacterium]